MECIRMENGIKDRVGHGTEVDGLLCTGRVGYGKELNYPGYLGQCMVGRVSYLGRIKQGNFHTHVLYTIPNPNYTLPKPYRFIIIYPIHHPTLGTRTGRVLPYASINTTLPWIPTYTYPSIVIPYPSTYLTLPTVGKIPLPTLNISPPTPSASPQRTYLYSPHNTFYYIPQPAFPYPILLPGLN